MRLKMLKDAEEKMRKVDEFFLKEISSLRAGRASVSLLEGIVVDYYGSKLPISQMATVTIPQPQLIHIAPWDKTMVEKVAKAIQSSNLGLNPIADPNGIRIPIPPLSQERREEIVKILHRMAEEARVELREIRRKTNEELKKAEKEKKLSEDDLRKGMEEVQKLLDRFIRDIDEKTRVKEKEIREG